MHNQTKKWNDKNVTLVHDQGEGTWPYPITQLREILITAATAETSLKHTALKPRAFIPRSPTYCHHRRKEFFTYYSYTRRSAPSKYQANHSLSTAAGPLKQQVAGLELDGLIKPPKLDMTGKTLNWANLPQKDKGLYYIVFKLSPSPEEAQQGELLCSHRLPPTRSISQEAGTRPSCYIQVPALKILPSFLHWEHIYPDMHLLSLSLSHIQLSSASKRFYL